ncbi:MAG: response regulator [Gammaproteobacteria bacterium]
MTDKDAKAPLVHTLMVVEDDAIERMIYERVLKRSGIVANILSFSYAEEALAHLQDAGSDSVDAILLDINMPRMDGFEFLDALKRQFGARFRAVVFMLTSSTNPRDAARADTYAIVRDFFNKPLDDDLIARIAEGVQTA